MSATDNDSNDLTYQQAADRIEQTLKRIEGDQDVDIDELADQVETATELIQFCLGRLERAELRVQKVTEKLRQLSERSAAASVSPDTSSPKASAGETEDEAPF